MRCLWCAVIAVLMLILPLGSTTLFADPVAEPLYFYASQSGRATLDQGVGGGNPFASALVELLARDHLMLEDFASDLVALTVKKSSRFQRPEVPAPVDLGAWQPFSTDAATGERVALVVVFSDYSPYHAVMSLPGAKHDMQRIAKAFDGAGFEVQISLDPDHATLAEILKVFADRSKSAEMAVLYTTGHGAEVDGVTYLLPGDYPFLAGSAELGQHAILLANMGSVLQARRANWIFYGGCRDNPFETLR